MTKTSYIICLLYCVLCGCNNDESTISPDTSLASLVFSNEIEIDNVIACASGSKSDENTIIPYLYPRPEAEDIRYFETSGIEVDKNNYQNYQQVMIEPTDVFNGYLKKITRITTEEKWVIVTFFEKGKLHLSNPIRLKHRTKPTEFIDEVMIDMNPEEMPIFSWEDGFFDDNKIYFQVISDSSNEFLSGTYTFERQFQYYKTDNVVLNITQGIPPQLDSTSLYNFTLMGVSEDNWVNLFIEKEFNP
ncbi:hypothetical protein SAMN04487910_2830 [Aquimarina amphilecti]|uniref:Uncharacterized protein n=1 Tax=Aquimarina amphilecti TaxID=1038014 RepID=A0A1H7RQ63_AQUAM|nr:hypothetical protein [Aquimarina amphilecti]SEL62376.1 hypothetical protein SAMN04487910_2830 [Aquimarina amphilecti]